MGARGVPRVSVGVPVYNGERYLAETLDSLLGQTYEDFELIICDNGSTDGTLKQVQEHFKLRKANLLYVPEVRCAPVHALYISTLDRRLLVVDKQSGGNKADAVNAGLNQFEGYLASGRKVGGLAFYFRNWPDEKEYYVQRTLGGKLLERHGLRCVALLGSDTKISFDQRPDGLHVHLPAQSPAKYAYAVRITFHGNSQ